MTDVVVREFAGKEREFRLLTGGVLDLEEAVGDRIGAIFIRLSGGGFGFKDVFHTIRLALIDGGADHVEVARIMANNFPARPLMERASLAGEILCALMVGVEASEDEGASHDEPQRYRFSEVVQICQVFHMSPQDLRRLRYSDFVNLVRGFNAKSGDQIEHLSEEEFMDILERHEPEAVS